MNNTNLLFPFSLIYPLILLAGAGFVFGSLRCYFSRFVAAVTSVLLVFATNLFYLSILNPLPQPVLLFVFYAALLFLTITWYKKPSLSVSVLMGIVTGLIMLIQADGYFAILVPLLWNETGRSGRDKLVLIRLHWQHVLLFTVSVTVIIISLMAGFPVKPGEIPLLNISLPGTFCIGSRFLWNDLFSFDHGWLIYAPVLIVPAIGFWFFAERYQNLFIPVNPFPQDRLMGFVFYSGNQSILVDNLKFELFE